MDESLFWTSLEFRLCGELKGMPEKELRRLWCDGFEPEQYILQDPAPRITGYVWIVHGSAGQERWTFTLFIHSPVDSSSEINWDPLLPPDNMTRWLAVDMHGRRIQIEPSAAVLDTR